MSDEDHIQLDNYFSIGVLGSGCNINWDLSAETSIGGREEISGMVNILFNFHSREVESDCDQTAKLFKNVKEKTKYHRAGDYKF